MTREETIKSIAKTIHRVEFPNSACWFGCNKCSYNGNCDYLKAAEIIYDQYVEAAETEIAKRIFFDIGGVLFSHREDMRNQDIRLGYEWALADARRATYELEKKYKVED